MSAQRTGRRRTDCLPRARVVIRPALDGEHLETAAGSQSAALGRKEAIEPGGGLWSSVSYTTPVAGSTATASCTNRPMALSGTGVTCPSAETGTSKM